MKLNQMYQNVLSFSLENLITKVEKDSLIRDAALKEAMTKIAVAPIKSGSITSSLNEAEKAILKALGLTPKAIKQLKGA